MIPRTKANTQKKIRLWFDYYLKILDGSYFCKSNRRTNLDSRTDCSEFPEDKPCFALKLSNSCPNCNDSNDDISCGRPGAFMNQISANERRDALTAAQAYVLRTEAQDIRSILD